MICIAPQIALKPIAMPISEGVALIIGAIAAIAELPQIEFPVANKSDKFELILNIFLAKNIISAKLNNVANIIKKNKLKPLFAI